MSIAKLIGRTVATIDGLVEGSENVTLTFRDGSTFRMWHREDCCETVEVAEIHGDVDWLIGSPILTADERINDDNPDGGESSTWTFYEIATNKGSVTIRWCGSSNGYYSETVELTLTEAQAVAP